MLKTLTVWNFALLAHVSVDFGHGLNILTGETGAGKSIIIDAIGLLLGRRMSTDLIRTGCDSLKVQAVFDISDTQPALRNFLDEQMIDCQDDELIIARQIGANGRSYILVNGNRVTLTILKVIGSLLIDIHGQHENLALMKEENQFNLIDNSADDVRKALADYRNAFSIWNDVRKELERRKREAEEYSSRIDMLRWQDQEISSAELKDGEDEKLEAEIRKASHAEKISTLTGEAYDLLDGSSDTSVLASLSRIRHDIDNLVEYDSTLGNVQQMLEEAETNLQEASYEIQDYGGNIDFSQANLDKLENRLNVIDKLRRKYGATVQDIIEHHAKVKEELQSIENYDDDIKILEDKMKKAETTLRKSAGKLSAARSDAAASVSESICREIKELGMPRARFIIKIHPLDAFQRNGCDGLDFLFSANPGEDPRPLSKIASGGELSRIALAVKAIEASHEGSVSSMVFDEIDTGIGGRTAQMVADRIAIVAKHRQVLCITHLPQIACMADKHFYIRKLVVDDKTETEVQLLDDGGRESEIARMASGSDISAASLDNAREMIDNARIRKNKIKKDSKY